MIKTLIRLTVLGLAAHALYHFIPVWVHYQQFQDDVEQTALFSGAANEAQLTEQVMSHARNRSVPLESSAVSVTIGNNQTAIRAVWSQPIKVLPWHTYVHTFEVSTSAWQVRAR